MIPPTVVFDLDGTLVDTAPDLVTALNVILAREGIPPVDFAEARNMVGGGARAMLERGLVAEGRALPAGKVEQLVKDFISHYADHIADGSRPFPGVEAALDTFAGHGFRLAVCTNKLEWLARRLLDRLGLSQRFAAICGADTFAIAKPDPRILIGAIKRAGGDILRSVLIGDSTTDILTARAAGIPVVAVDFGYSEIPAARLDADRVASRFADVPPLVADLLALPMADRPRELD
jgi:phosphoglycolate phosphatase